MINFTKLRRQLGWLRAVELSGMHKLWVLVVMTPQFWTLMLFLQLAFFLKRLGLGRPAAWCVRLAIAVAGDDSALGYVYGWIQPGLLPGERERGLSTQHMRVGMMLCQLGMDWLTRKGITDKYALMVTNGLRDRLVSTMYAARHARNTGNRVRVYWINWKVDRYPAATFFDLAKLEAAGVDIVEVDCDYDFKIPGHGSLKFSLLTLETYALSRSLNCVTDWSFFWSNPPKRKAGDEDPKVERGRFMHINLIEVVEFLRDVSGGNEPDPKFTSGELLTANYGADLAVTATAEDVAWKVVYDPLSRGPLRVDDGARVVTQQNDGDLEADSLANLRCLLQFDAIYVGTASSFCDVVLAYNMAARAANPGVASNLTIVQADNCP